MPHSNDNLIRLAQPMGSVCATVERKFVILRYQGKVPAMAGLYKGMSRTFFSLRRRRGFASRYPAPLTIEDARGVSCPWGIPSQQLHLCE